MSEVLVQFDEPQPAPDGRLFIAQVDGQRVSEGLWEAWIEFYPRDGGEPIRTRRETEQLTRGDLRFWAAGITRRYLSEALVRALAPERSATPRGISVPMPESALASARSGMHSDERMVLETNLVHISPAPLDPVEIYRRAGEYRLRQELRALDAKQLRDVIVAYDVPEFDMHDLVRTFEDALAERIVAAVQQRVGANRTRPSEAGAEQRE